MNEHPVPEFGGPEVAFSDPEDIEEEGAQNNQNAPAVPN